MKQFKLTYDEIFTFENLYKAHIKARSGKRSRNHVVKFELNLLSNLDNLYNQLKSRKYEIKSYNSFVVYEPKKRQIQTLRYSDRLVQRLLCDVFLSPFFTQRAVIDNCVCQPGKGLHFCLSRLKNMLARHIAQHGDSGYVVRCDIKKYFPSIPHDKLKAMILSYIENQDLKDLVEKIINSHHTNAQYLQKYQIPPCTQDDVHTGRGIPIGNQSSQIFGMFYLNPVDRLIKEKLRIKIYTRYMDDFLFICQTKLQAEEALKQVAKKVDELGLFLNAKTQIFPLKNGFSYLGYHFKILPSGKIVQTVLKRTSKRLRWRAKYLTRLYKDGYIDAERVNRAMVAFHGHLVHADAWILEQELKFKLSPILNERRNE